MKPENFEPGIPDPAHAELLFLELPQVSKLEGSLLVNFEKSDKDPQEVYSRKWSTLLFLLPVASLAHFHINSPRVAGNNLQMVEELSKSWRFKIDFEQLNVRAEFHKNNEAFLYKENGEIQRGTWTEIYTELLKLPQLDHLPAMFFQITRPDPK